MTQKPTEPKIGIEMPDGTIYVGISPETNKPMYAVPVDANLLLTFNQAKEYASKLDAHGYQDWRLPTKAELNVLFNNRADIGWLDINPPSLSGRLLVRSPGAPAR